ncbi:coiled-coil domain-containing protein 169-like isoform X2 [Pseudonaja textilis]|uniref:coiled-coil domain-containing protein 169-like isoform X2 n=1 Tax=Pseudonaja textilis TaxID=8673 RepID=UPI000EA89E61|nr:coiled-coil domain-containing protein 169-like isoform X2 [Pseudonaja textilis]
MGEGGAPSQELGFEGVQLELTQEKQMKEMLELSIFEMNNTVAELEKRLNRTDDEDKLASVRSFKQMHMDSLNRFLKKLEGEKKGLQNQLKEYELRLDQEAKAYHKANDERRAYLAMISQISGSLKPLEKQKIDVVEMKRENQVLRRKCNIPRNQRILDPKKGPIKKTAGVKQLPKLKL